MNQVKPIKKEYRKSEDKYNLEVVTVDYRRHKSVEHKREKSAEKHKTDHSKNDSSTKKEMKIKEDEKTQDKHIDDRGKRYRSHSGTSSRKKTVEDDRQEQETSKRNISKDSKYKDKQHDKDQTEKNDRRESHEKKDHHKKPSSSSHKPESRTRRTSSSEKKLVKSNAICDETDADVKDRIAVDDKTKVKTKDGKSNINFLSANECQLGYFLNADNPLVIKPPNILVYADSLVAKENVKAALVSILNRDK